MKTSIVDQPKEHDTKDQFGIDKYELALVKFIESADTPITIALQGEWGSGKTSLMNTLKHSLTYGEKASYHKVWINTWQHSLMSSPEEAIIMILNEIIEQISSFAGGDDDGEKNKEIVKKCFSIVARIGKTGLKAVGNMAGNAVGIDKLGNAVADASVEMIGKTSKISSESEISQLKKSIACLINDTIVKTRKKGFLFFIDDLDRIDPPVAVQILELLKNIFDLEKCVFVLAIDYDVVIKGLKPKFGELTEKNEREFRSFFDKIIQLPFSMPVASYKIDKFLISTLSDIGFISDAEANDAKAMEKYSEFASLSVGTNPRSLKRLTNILSLIQLLQDKKQGDEALDNEKVINFALVCLQIGYPQVYNYLATEPNFKEWHNTLKKKLNLQDLLKEDLEKIEKYEEFNEEWEQFLYLLCKKDPYLHGKVFQISRLLNKLATLIPEEQNMQEDIGIYISKIIQLSAITNLQAGDKPPEKAAAFHHAHWLRCLDSKLLTKLKAVTPPALQPVSMPQSRVQTKLRYHFKGGDGYVSFGISQDQYVVAWWKGDYLYWGECTQNTFEEELVSRGIKKEEFEQIQKEFTGLKEKYKALTHDGNNFPVYRTKGDGKLLFDYGNSFSFPFAKLENAVSDEAVGNFASFIVEFLTIRAKMLALLERKSK